MDRIKGNDIYVFFESIEQLEPQSVLDVGMLLKRLGGVSRKVMNLEMAENIQLDGVDFYPEISFPVWKNVYDHIISADSFVNAERMRKYDLAIFLLSEQKIRDLELHNLIQQMKKSARYVLSDCDPKLLADKTCKIIVWKNKEAAYYLANYGE